MGGHDHHHAPEYVVPKAEIYKVEDVPELIKLQEDLAKKGLKDPWARNEVWRYHKQFGTPWGNVLTGLFRGWKIAIPAFLLTIAIENALGIDYSHHGGHEDEHGEHH